MNIHKLLSAALLLGLSAAAAAVPLTGSIEVEATGVQVGTDSIDFGDVTVPADGVIDSDFSNATATGASGFLNSVFSLSGADVVVVDITGAGGLLFSTLVASTSGEQGLLQFNGTLASSTTSPLDLIFNGLLSFVGTNCTGACGYDATPASFQATAQANPSDFLISIASTSASVAEPATLALVALGIAGIGAARRKQA